MLNPEVMCKILLDIWYLMGINFNFDYIAVDIKEHDITVMQLMIIYSSISYRYLKKIFINLNLKIYI